MKKFIFALCLVPSLALAQAPTPSEQDILAATIGNLFKENARLAVEIQRLQIALKEKTDAERKQAPSQTDGSGGQRPEVRQEGGGASSGRP